MDVKRVQRQGDDYLVLSDPRGFAKQALLVPRQMAHYLALADGTRTVAEIAAAGALRGASPASPEALREVFEQLDSLFMLENGAYRAERDQRLADYRRAPFRPPALAGPVYAPEPDAMKAQLDGYRNGYQPVATSPTGTLAAIVSPHIDYARGGPSYYAVWDQARPGLEDIELAVIFGTDHNGDGPRMTLTRQRYATPLGSLPSDVVLVSDLAGVLSADPELPGHPFSDEFNHIGEHSVELAAVWLHHAAGRAVTTLPVLCGSLHRYVAAGPRAGVAVGSPETVAHIASAVRMLQDVARRKRTVFIAAADLAHVGPAFGDRLPVTGTDRDRVGAADSDLMDAVALGDRSGFLEGVRSVGDAYRICGLAPIYMALWAAEGATGSWFGYRQCPADSEDASFVSIAGALLYR